MEPLTELQGLVFLLIGLFVGYWLRHTQGNPQPGSQNPTVLNFYFSNGDNYDCSVDEDDTSDDWKRGRFSDN